MPLDMVPGLTQEVVEADQCKTPQAACDTVQAAALSAACASQMRQVRARRFESHCNQPSCSQKCNGARTSILRHQRFERRHAC